jgi:hypothetical protein
MNRGLFPIILVLLAIGLFVFYTDGAYQDTKVVSAELAQYNSALDTSEQVIQLRDSLLAQRNSFPQDGLSRLQLLLPDNIDNIRLIIDINDIAARYHLQVQGISLGSTPENNPAPTDVTSGATADISNGVGGSSSVVGSVTLGFTVNSDYKNFIAFMRDLEKSLRLVDASNISFKASDKAQDAYEVVITTYWLK